MDLRAARAEQVEACEEVPDFGERVACRRDARVVSAGPGRRSAVAVIVEPEGTKTLPTFQVDVAVTGGSRGLSAFVETHGRGEHYGVNAGVGWREAFGNYRLLAAGGALVSDVGRNKDEGPSEPSDRLRNAGDRFLVLVFDRHFGGAFVRIGLRAAPARWSSAAGDVVYTGMVGGGFAF